MTEIDFANDRWNQDERLAYILHQFDGSQAVIDAVNRGKIRHDEWAICMGCDAELPFLNGECLMCSGEKVVEGECKHCGRYLCTYSQCKNHEINCCTKNSCAYVMTKEDIDD
jgi:hypothetical protein